jgi:redox-sensitive bicupin YhaK (pirin superfamily)
MPLQFEKYSSLRVINEDRVAGGQGFGAHGHRDFEIFSYVLEGRLEHKDSMGNKEVLERGQVQFTSAGSGITHRNTMQTRGSPCAFCRCGSSRTPRA